MLCCVDSLYLHCSHHNVSTGLPGLQPGLADKLQLEQAKDESIRVIDENMQRKMDIALEESKHAYSEMEDGHMKRVLRESEDVAMGNDMDAKKALYLSEMEAADFDLEQAVLASSLESWRKSEQERKPSSTRRSEGRRNRYNSSPNAFISRGSRSPSSSVSCIVAWHGCVIHIVQAYFPSLHLSIQPIHRNAAASSTAASANFSNNYPSSSCHYYAAASAAAASSAASFPRARSSSPPNDNAALASGNRNVNSDECPPSVQELVMNGFALHKVLHAYDLIGDNFDDLLSFLLSSTS